MSINSKGHTLDRAITSLDLLKTLAVTLMVIDHVGLYFYPDEAWFRVVGRLCVPIWFFLIGYAKREEIPATWWLGAVMVGVTAPISGQYIFPLNILFMLILARYWKPQLIRVAIHSPEALRGMFLVLAFMAMPSNAVLEYGALGLLFVIGGYIVREWQIVRARIKPLYIVLYWSASLLVYWMMQGGFSVRTSLEQKVFMFVGLGVLGIVLMRFRKTNFPRLTHHMTPPLAFVLRATGRQTLWIYVLHIILFRIMAVYAYPEYFPLFKINLMAPNILGVLP